jgi:hypothetical protein
MHHTLEPWLLLTYLLSATKENGGRGMLLTGRSESSIKLSA